ncbi:MAG: RsmB/NOP family class I SAM-dependent RNA methyltransferase [Myxococcales bacterium]|nr:RsmB/NOP family class I SAM-dependent RNA methyltransferase [Myxococcales bacterium]MCB9731751.1 RsmB/NOP family class I SAM-dependent RNA methyltransferase [Deltaproteobacteria bacterium]
MTSHENPRAPQAARPLSERDPRVTRLLLDLWAQTRADWGFVTTRLAQAFREARFLHSRDRRDVAEAMYGMVRRVRAIDRALERAGAPSPPALPTGEPTPARALHELLAYELLTGATEVAAARARGGADVGWEAVLAPDEGAESGEAALGVAQGLPDWLAARFLATFGDDAEAVAAALNERAPLTLRANRLKTGRDALRERLLAEGVPTEPTRWASDGLTSEPRLNMFGLRSFRDGLFEVQDEASQLVAELTAPPPRGLVVDACAGAGGKTLALGALMGNKGRVVSLDVSGRKLVELRKRARRAGLSNHQALEIGEDGPLPAEVARLAGKVDRVLVDAPCSGIGALRRNPEARWRLDPAFAAALPETQAAIALRMLPLVKPGGRLVYATCTILPEENEEVVARILAEAPVPLERIAVAEILGRKKAEEIVTADGFAIATRPDRHGMDGFFATALRVPKG